MFNNGSQKTSKCGKKNISDTLNCASCVAFLFLLHFIVICDLPLSICRSTWNPDFQLVPAANHFGNKNLNKYHSLFLWYDAKCRWESSHKLLLKSWRKLQKNKILWFSFALFLHVTAQNMTQPIITYYRVLTVIQELYTSLNYIQLIQWVLNIQILIISLGRRWGMPYVDATWGLLGWSYH